jgi:hypothetical protein
MLDLKIDDSRIRTQILEDISNIYGLVNRAKASIEIKRKSLGSVEAKAEFSARFKLLSQSVTGALNSAKTPQECDEQLSRLLIQLEELESQFSEYDEFLADILSKRDDIYDSFEKHKQTLIDARQRRALNLSSAAERILQGINRRVQSFNELDVLNTYFASDPMISKLRALITELKNLDDQIKADDLQAKLKATKDQGIRSLRDKLDIYTDSGNTVSIGKHQFSVNKQVLDLTLLPKDGELTLHLTGSDYFETINNKIHKTALDKNKHLWQQTLISESDEIYRGEYLASQILLAADSDEHELSFTTLLEAQKHNTLPKLVQAFAEPRYQEGYEKGIHDQDATLILAALLNQKSNNALLIYPVTERIFAALFWIKQDCEYQKTLLEQAKNAALMQAHFNDSGFFNSLNFETENALQNFLKAEPKLQNAKLNANAGISAQYLLNELACIQNTKDHPEFSVSLSAKNLSEQFIQDIKSKGIYENLQQANDQMCELSAHWQLFLNWLNAYNLSTNKPYAQTIVMEAAHYLMQIQQGSLKFKVLDNKNTSIVTGLMGQHSRIKEQNIEVDYADFFARSHTYQQIQVPAFNDYHQLRTEILIEEKERLQLDEFKARPLSSFVRNQLIDKVYFPIIGDNLAKQIGAAGNNKRTDLMGMLLLISPPGYGKTTLIEYITNRLGLTFVKVNCPSIGHDQVSLDPAQAINATAEKEIEKINQSFEMGNNVMLYLDDIQHTNPEFLQKFISLCDGSRRIDGVWKGKSKTYDLRGKKFAVVMAGNPYTESGESFKIPDMLSNRADIYNLGDTLSGCESEFAMSFIENAMTSNSVLAPLANRNMQDLYKLIRICGGEDISLNELEHGYSQAEANEIQAVLSKLIVIRQTVLKVNAQYIASAAQDDKYRTEPPFKLQGSYRNMNKMAEKVVAVMNDEELESLIQDHYQGEAQTLSKGSEENLLKLGELRGTLTKDETERFQNIKDSFSRLNSLDTAGSPAMLAVNQMSLLHEALENISSKLDKKTLSWDHSDQFYALAESIKETSTQEQLSTIANKISNSINNTDNQAQLTELINAVSSLDNKTQLTALADSIKNTNTQEQLTNIANNIENTDNQTQLTELINAVNNLDQKAELAELIKINSDLNNTLSQQKTPEVNIDNHTDPQVADAVQAIAQTIEVSLLPVLKIMHHKIRLDHDVWNKVDAISKKLRQLDPAFNVPETTLTDNDQEIIIKTND